MGSVKLSYGSNRMYGMSKDDNGDKRADLNGMKMCRIQSNLHMGERLISATVESPEDSLGCHKGVHAVLGARDVGRSDSWQSHRQTEGDRDITRYQHLEPSDGPTAVVRTPLPFCMPSHRSADEAVAACLDGRCPVSVTIVVYG